MSNYAMFSNRIHELGYGYLKKIYVHTYVTLR